MFCIYFHVLIIGIIDTKYHMSCVYFHVLIIGIIDAEHNLFYVFYIYTLCIDISVKG